MPSDVPQKAESFPQFVLCFFFQHTDCMSNIFHNIFGGSEGKILAHVRGTSRAWLVCWGKGEWKDRAAGHPTRCFPRSFIRSTLYFSFLSREFLSLWRDGGDLKMLQKKRWKLSDSLNDKNNCCQKVSDNFCSTERYETLLVWSISGGRYKTVSKQCEDSQYLWGLITTRHLIAVPEEFKTKLRSECWWLN